MLSPTLPRTPTSPDTINLATVARGVMRKVPAVLAFAVLAGVVTGGVLATMAPKYLSQAQLEVRGTSASEASGRPDKEAVGTHVRGLMSTELALKMSATLHLTQSPEFNSALEPSDLFGRTLRRIGLGGAKTGETDEDRLMQAYFQNVRAYQVRDTRSIIVDCTTSNAKFSAECANALASLYRDSLRGRDVNDNSDIRAKLKPQVERLTREAAEAESLVGTFRGQANLFQGGAQATQLRDQQLAELSAELTRVANTRSEAETRANTARDMAARGIAATNPDVQKATLIPNMEEQRVGLERQIAELSATLLPGHPRMKQLQSELANLRAQIKAQVTKVVDSLGSDARIAADREAGIRRRVDEMKRTLVSGAPDTARLAQLENATKAKRAELERLQSQYEKAASSAGAGSGSVEIEIVSRAYPSNEKVFPKIGSMAAITAFAAAIFGLFATLTRELARGARPAVPAPAASRELLSAVPVSPVTAPLRTPQLVSVFDAAAMLGAAGTASAQAFRILAAGGTDSIDVGDTALALGQHLAAGHHRSIVVVWDGAITMPGNSLEPAPGTEQLLAGHATLEEAIQRVPHSSLDVIAGRSNATATLDTDSASMLLDALDEMYDFIVVCASKPVATALFTAVQGRFDAGVIVAAAQPAAQPDAAQPAFLGFIVPDFTVLTVAKADAAPSSQIASARTAARSAARA